MKNLIFNKRFCYAGPEGLGRFLDTAVKAGSEALKAGESLVSSKKDTPKSQELLNVIQNSKGTDIVESLQKFSPTIAKAAEGLNPKDINDFTSILSTFPSMGPDTVNDLLSGNGESLSLVNNFLTKFNIKDINQAMNFMKNPTKVEAMAKWFLDNLEKSGLPVKRVLGLLADTLLPKTIEPLLKQILLLVPAKQYKQVLMMVLPHMPAEMVKQATIELVKSMPPEEVVKMIQDSDIPTFWESIGIKVAVAFGQDEFVKKEGARRLSEMPPETVKRIVLAELSKMPPEKVKSLSINIIPKIGDQYYQQARGRIMKLFS